MKKFFILCLMAFVICSCGNKEYCRSCEQEIISINNKISWEYDQMVNSYDVYKNTQYFGVYLNESEKHKSEIKRLEEKRTYYELEIKKYSRKWEYWKVTEESYQKVKTSQNKYYNKK